MKVKAIDWKIERDALVRRFYGERQDLLGRKRQPRGTVRELVEDDYLGIPTPVNNPFIYAGVGECLIWLWGMNRGGYGLLSFEGRSYLAHRVAFEQSRGIVADGQINHLCNRPFCLQPAHLYEGDAQDNADDRLLLSSTGAISLIFTRRSSVTSI